MESLIVWLREAPLTLAIPLLLVQNTVVLVFALVLGEMLIRLAPERRVAPPPPPLERLEVLVTISIVFLNTVVTIVGLILWRADWIRFRTDAGIYAFLDVLVLLLIMDLAMYLLHRLAHHPWLYPLLHRLHHRYDRPRPLTLFILNPAENLAFGALWLTVIALYPASWLGMSIYLVLNVVFGTIGHLGVEPMPDSSARQPVLRWVAGSTFHARHHQQQESNFGFYTVIWDRLFGTLHPKYFETFGRLPEEKAEPREQVAG